MIGENIAWDMADRVRETLAEKGYKYDPCNYSFHKGKFTIRMDIIVGYRMHFDNWCDGRFNYTGSIHSLNKILS